MPRVKAYVLEHRVADRREPRIRRLMAAAIRDAKQLVSESALEEAFAFGDAQSVVAAIPFDRIRDQLYRDIRLILRDTLGRTAITLQREINVAKDTLGELGFRFDITNTRVFAWIEQHAAELVVGIDAESREAIRSIIERMFRQGIPPRAAAREIQRVIGLTQRQATALENYRQSLGPTERLDELLDRYAGRLLRQRAIVIARTEAMTAANQGQHELWRQAADQGFLERERTMRKWIITPDERLCPICEPVPGNGPVGLEDPFVLGNGAVVMNPPAHPSCRCVTALEFVD